MFALTPGLSPKRCVYNTGFRLLRAGGYLRLRRTSTNAPAGFCASSLRIWWSIVLSLARPALTAVVIIVFLQTWNSFFWPLIVTRTDAVRTLPVGMAQFMSLRPGQAQQAQSFGLSMAGAVLAAFPPMVVFFILQRYFIRGISTTGLK